MDITENTLLRVYYNLHRNCYSIQARSQGNWLVCNHVNDNLNLNNVKFQVSQAGRNRVLSTKCKNVHAYVTGRYSNVCLKGVYVEITYNPYKYATFVTVDGKLPVYDAITATIKASKLLAIVS
jgi:hypothetical protein